MQIFLCFSSGDRYTIVNSILYNLKQFGIPIWYDYHELTLGDDRIIGNFVEGLDLCDYSIVILSTNMFECKCGNDELDVIKKRYFNNTMHIFPLFYNIKAYMLPERYNWLKSLIYNEIEDNTGTLSACKQIVYQIVKDELKTQKRQSLNLFIDSSDIFINNALQIYNQTDVDNFNSRFTILYMIYIYISEKDFYISDMHKCILQRMCKISQLNISFPHKDMLIIETILIILLNNYFDD